MVDFKKRLAKRDAGKLIDPVAIYETPDRASDKSPLRPAQAAILRTWQGTIPRVAKVTAVDVLVCVDELTDRTGGSVDAVMGEAVGPYRKSRIRSSQDYRARPMKAR